MRKLKTLLIAVMSLVAMATTAQEKTAYVVLCGDIRTLYFLNRSETLTEEELYKGIPITKLWSGEQVTNTGINQPGWITYIQEKNIDIYDVVIDESFKDVKPKSLVDWFNGFSNLSSIKGLEYLNTSEATDMSSMFQNCRALTELDLSSFDTGKVEDMTNMFLNCTSLKKLDLSSFNTSNVWIMNSMFNGCEALTELDLSSFDTRKVTYMTSMFAYCRALTELDLSSFTTPAVTNINSMFNGCSALETITFGEKFTTEKVKYMSFVFSGCSALTKLDLSSFTTPAETSMSSMFSNCTALTDLDIRNFEISSAISDGIVKCNNLMKLDMSNATGEVTLLAGNTAFDGRGMIISVPEDFDLANVSTENYIVKTTGTSFARTFTAGNMSTICLPFAIDATAVAEQGTLYKYVGIDGDEVKFTAVTGETTPDEAYLFNPATSDKVIFTGADVMTDQPADIEEKDAPGLYGTYKGKTFTADEADFGIYFGWANGSFWRAGNGATVKHNRAYLKAAAGTTPARLNVKLDNGVTGIESVPAESPADSAAPAYNLNGQRVSGSYKGIVIKNGKKVKPHPASPK